MSIGQKYRDTYQDADEYPDLSPLRPAHQSFAHEYSADLPPPNALRKTSLLAPIPVRPQQDITDFDNNRIRSDSILCPPDLSEK